MSTTVAGNLKALPAEALGPLERLRDELVASQGKNLAALLVYGSAVRGGWDPADSDVDVVVVLEDTAMDLLLACGQPLVQARFAARVEAMILKRENIAPAADVFPLLYDDIRSRHVLLAGSDPFSSLHISDAHRRLRIEQELREARIRMRRAIVDALGDDHAIAGALARKVKQVRSPLHALLCLQGISCDDTLETVVREAGKAWGVRAEPLLRVHEDPRTAHAAFRELLDAAVEAADRLPVGAGA